MELIYIYIYFKYKYNINSDVVLSHGLVCSSTELILIVLKKKFREAFSQLVSRLFSSLTHSHLLFSRRNSHNISACPAEKTRVTHETVTLHIREWSSCVVCQGSELINTHFLTTRHFRSSVTVITEYLTVSKRPRPLEMQTIRFMLGDKEAISLTSL